MDKLHAIISEIKRYYQDYGKPPSIAELRAMGYSKYIIEKHSMRQLCEMAGVNEVRVNSDEVKKITNDIFKKDLEQHLSEYKQRDFKSQPIKSSILVAGDTHFCFHNSKTIDKFLEFNRKYQPENVVQVGDLYDLYAYSKFPRSQNIYTPAEEERLSRQTAEKFFADIIRDNKKANVFNMLGNHDLRIIKRTIESLPQLENIVERHLREIMTFDGVKLIEDHREPLEIDGILFHHGYLGKLGDHRDSALQNFVCGHSHRAGVSYRRIKNETLWELNAGFMGDPESKVMSYTSSKIQNYTLGFGYIDELGPRFIHT
jgi:UDP-2,3-diacylglucosamine pyrophosphatase LpxH